MAPKFYAVRVGRKPGIYSSWDSCKEQVERFQQAKFKSFSTRAEAQKFVDGGCEAGTKRAAPLSSSTTTSSSNSGGGSGGVRGVGIYGVCVHTQEQREATHRQAVGDEAAPAPKRRKTTTTQPAEHEQDSHIQQTRRPDTDDEDTVTVYTDGSSLGNGAAGAVAGVGVYFAPSDPRNVSEALPGARQTNQRAELTAIVRALEIIPRHRRVKVYSDSNYAIKCVTEWCGKWQRNGWVNAAGKPVENRDLVERVLLLLREREEAVGGEGRGGKAVEFVWVKGHASNAGNAAADALAVAGSRAAAARILAERGSS